MVNFTARKVLFQFSFHTRFVDFGRKASELLQESAAVDAERGGGGGAGGAAGRGGLAAFGGAFDFSADVVDEEEASPPVDETTVCPLPHRYRRNFYLDSN